MSKIKLVAMLAVLSVTATACKKQEAQVEEKPLVLNDQDVATARLMNIHSGPVVTGSLQPAWIVNVKAQVPGTVENIAADRGVAVGAGQVLATLRADGIRSQADGARAGVAAAQAGLVVAQQRLESAKTLRAAGALSEIDFKAATAGYEAAVAQLAAARAGMAAASEADSHATVRAPIAGVVSARFVEAGEAVNPGQPLFTVVRADYLELSGQVPIESANSIKPGQDVVFALDAYPDRQFSGNVSRIEPTANTDTRQVGVYVRMRNPGNLVGGQFASGRIQTSEIAQALVIPAGALRGSGADTNVLLIENGRAIKRLVTIGATDDGSGLVQITNGLKAGDVVIATPGSAITEGARVQVAPPVSPAPTAQKD